MAHLHNTSGFAEEAREPADYYPYFGSLRAARDQIAASAEMSTESTVRYLREGFSLYLPR